ncbi:hypothetical protein D9M73_207280 [compost metagenome]
MWIERALVMAILTITNTYQTISDKIMTVSRITGWHYTVEHIDTAAHRFNDIFRFTNAHQVTRFILWHFAW